MLIFIAEKYSNEKDLDSIVCSNGRNHICSDENIMPTVIDAVENKCTLGEIADTLREVYGEHR